jgi:hypothetical protein
MRSIFRRIADAFSAYARWRGLNTGEYRIFVNPHLEWGQCHVIFAMADIPDRIGNPWFDIMYFLDGVYQEDPGLLDLLSFTVSTFAQIQAGGYHALPEIYEDINDILIQDPAA